MANTLITSTIISKELTLQFENMLVLGKSVDWGFNEKFGVKDAQIGASYRVRRPTLMSATRNNLAYSAQNVVDTFSQVTVANSLTTAFNFTDADLTLKVENFSDRYVKQAVTVLAALFDSDIASALTNCAVGTQIDGATSPTPNAAGWVVGTYGTPITSDTVLQAKQILLDAACPDDGDITGILTPLANRQLANAQITLFNAQKQISDIYRKGYIGEFAGIEFSVSQSLVAHTNGAQASIVVGATQDLATGWAETKDITITALTGAVKAGDVFTNATVYWVNPLTKAVTSTVAQFTVVADANVGATTVTVSPAPITAGAFQNISTGISGKTLTLVGSVSTTGMESLIFHKKAVAVVSPELEMPKKSSFDMAELIDTDSARIRFLRGYDAIGASGAVGFVSRLDFFYGIKTIRPEWIVRVRN